jgi:hypothetical protein
MIETPSTPLLGLRMRSSRSCPPTRSETETPDHAQVVQVMMQQDSGIYLCRDYLGRRIPNDTSPEACPQDDIVDAVCREKMCEWSYRVCDHFHTGREVVAISFSYLDRFIDKCSCDRTTFKLAAMTTLYMATKIFNSRQITICSLAELSRGEFEMSHIAEMEAMILQTLEWRMHPPTSQCFINHVHHLLPCTGQVSSAIYERANFFAELALYDYSFVARERSLITVAALMNAMEGMDESMISGEQQRCFLKDLQDSFGIVYSEEVVETIRNRLWYVYSMSAQYKEDDIITPQSLKDTPQKECMGSDMTSVSRSPVSVRQ